MLIGGVQLTGNARIDESFFVTRGHTAPYGEAVAAGADWKTS
jgi:hypothetical protein